MKFTIGFLLPFDFFKIMALLFILKLKKGKKPRKASISMALVICLCFSASYLYVCVSHRYTHIITHTITINY